MGKAGSREGLLRSLGAQRMCSLDLSWCQLAQLWVSSAARGWVWRRRLVTRLRGGGLAERVWWEGWLSRFRSWQAWHQHLSGSDGGKAQREARRPLRYCSKGGGPGAEGWHVWVKKRGR